jgi:hypothetical protein
MASNVRSSAKIVMAAEGGREDAFFHSRPVQKKPLKSNLLDQKAAVKKKQASVCRSPGGALGGNREMKSNLRILATISVVFLSGVTLAGCVSEGYGYDDGPRYSRPYDGYYRSYDGGRYHSRPRPDWRRDQDRERPRHWDRGDNGSRGDRGDRDGRPSRPNVRDRDDRGPVGGDRGGHRRWMQDDG